MANVILKESVWKDFVMLAKKRQRKPEALVEHLLRDYLARVADEELLARSAREARRNKKSVLQMEELIRRYRRENRD